MSLLAPLPLLTKDLPGIGGRIKESPDDFEVEEVPAYEPSGQGEFLFLWIEKRDMGAEYFMRQVAQRLGVRPDELGAAGLKDRRAVTRQWISAPATVESRVPQIDGDGIRVLSVSRHGNKLKPGHLRGNRFRIRIRNVSEQASAQLEPLLTKLRAAGLPNFYGEQRFGKEGETLELGLRMLTNSDQAVPRDRRFLRKLALTAVQSALFNRYLTRRFEEGLLHTVLSGDVMSKWPQGGLFRVTDVGVEQARFDRRETVHCGPMFGKKMFPAEGDAFQRETAVLAEAGLAPSSFHGFGKLLQGTRRQNLVYIDDLEDGQEGPSAWLSFTLPAGSYATVLLREVMKSDVLEAGAEGLSQPVSSV